MSGGNMKLNKVKITKIVVSMGVGEAAQDKKVLEPAIRDLMTITGQKPKVTAARVSIAEFKLRQGAPIGLMVTLRQKRAADFLQKLFQIVLPRLRDFQGVSLKGFDGHGNYNLGLTEQIVFPEIDTSKVNQARGLQITIVTDTDSDQKAKKHLADLGMVFEKKLALTTKGRKSG